MVGIQISPRKHDKDNQHKDDHLSHAHQEKCVKQEHKEAQSQQHLPLTSEARMM